MSTIGTTDRSGKTLRSRALRSKRLAALVLVVPLLAVSACGSDDDGSDAATAQPDADGGAAQNATDDASPGEETADDAEASDAGRDDAGTGDAGTGDGATTTAAESGESDPPSPALPITAQAICDRVPADQVAGALGVAPVTAAPGRSDTPQCAYSFTGRDGTSTNATISVLRTDEDLGGLTGAEAFDFVVDLNRSAAQSETIEERSLAVGTRAVLLSGANLHLAVVQLDERIATVIVQARAADGSAAEALAAATPQLAA